MISTRRIIQAGALALVVCGVVAFGASCERWCPFGGVEAIHEYVTRGTMVCSLGVSNFFILGGVLLTALLLRRAFCGYLCPLGTISEWIGLTARRLGVTTVRVPPGIDRVLSWLKYGVLGIVLWLTWEAGELIFRGFDPCYALISRHGTDITVWAYVVAGAIVIVSLVVTMPFCRWFCPMAAVLSPLSRFGLARIRRDAESCVDCGKCGRACPMAIPVEQRVQVTEARCLSCFNCVDSCPKKAAGTLEWGPPAGLGRRWPQAALVAVLLLCTGGAVAGSYFFPLPAYVQANEATPPEQTATVDLMIRGLECRGTANRLFFFLGRDDEFRIPGPSANSPGYFKLEAWPGSQPARIRVTYDPTRTDEVAIKRAITEPYFNVHEETRQSAWMWSPFEIEGYDPLQLDVDADTVLPLPAP